MEDDYSQVEMMLSSDEDVGGNHLNHNVNRKPYVAQYLRRTPKTLCFMAAATFLIFIIGYFIGYLVHQKREAPAITFDHPVPHETGAAPLMDWEDVKKLLAGKLSASNFESVLSNFSRADHRAGSSGDEYLGSKVLDKFNQFGMNTWIDEYFVKVQDPPAFGFNKFIFKNGRVETPSGFLSYSAKGTVTGAVLYGYYGQESDFRSLQNMNINMTGRVILVRAGRISFAEKVANAAKMNAAAVLIYPDAADYSFGVNTQLFGHVSVESFDV